RAAPAAATARAQVRYVWEWMHSFAISLLSRYRFLKRIFLQVTLHTIRRGFSRHAGNAATGVNTGAADKQTGHDRRRPAQPGCGALQRYVLRCKVDVGEAAIGHVDAFFPIARGLDKAADFAVEAVVIFGNNAQHIVGGLALQFLGPATARIGDDRRKIDIRNG